MLKSVHVSETPATQWLKQHGVAFVERTYAYVEHGGTAESARALGVDEHEVVKINGGRRGYLVGVEPRVLADVLGAIAVDCALGAP